MDKSHLCDYVGLACRRWSVLVCRNWPYWLHLVSLVSRVIAISLMGVTRSKVNSKFFLLKCRPNDKDYSFLAFSVGKLFSSDPICPTNHWKWEITRSSPLLRTLGNTKNHRSRVFCFCAKMYPKHESFYEMMKCLIDVVRTYDNRISRWYVSTFRTNAMGFITYPPLVHQHTPWLSKVVLFLSLNDFIMLTSW